LNSIVSSICGSILETFNGSQKSSGYQARHIGIRFFSILT